MNFNITKTDSSEKIINTLQEHGLAVCPVFLEDVENIKLECEKIIDNVEEDEYLFGKAAKIGSAFDNTESNPSIANFFSQNWMFEIFQKYTSKSPNFNEIFITHEFKNNNGVNRNGVLHFDKISTFKYMLYLTDVEEGCGALSVIPGSHLDGLYLRNQHAFHKRLPEDYYANFIFENYPELGYTEEDVVPIYGPAGTLIIFDTDLFHRGGLVADGKERLIIRSHIRGING